MNQNICANCQTINTPDKAFCVGCGQQLMANQAGYQYNQPPFAGSSGQMPNQPNFSPMPNRPLQAKKSSLGLWLAILGGAGFLIILIGGVGLLGIIYYVSSRDREMADNYNATSNTASQNNSLATNLNTSDNSLSLSTSMTEDEKYRLFYAASKIGDQALTMKVSKRIGIIDESNKPTPFYKTFTGGMVKWAFRDGDFVRKMDTKQKAIDYVNSVMPGAFSSSYQEVNQSPKTVSLGVVNGKATNLVTPAYPAAAKAVRASGAVNVQVIIDEAGNVTSASAVSGHPLLRASAEQAARASKFSPTVLGGQAVKATGIIVYNFVAE